MQIWTVGLALSGNCWGYCNRHKTNTYWLVHQWI